MKSQLFHDLELLLTQTLGSILSPEQITQDVMNFVESTEDADLSISDTSGIYRTILPWIQDTLKDRGFDWVPLPDPTLRFGARDFFLALSEKLPTVTPEVLELTLGRSAQSLIFERKKIQAQLGKYLLRKPKLIETHLLNQAPDLSSSRRHLSPVQRLILESLGILVVAAVTFGVLPYLGSKVDETLDQKINEHLLESALSDSPPPSGVSAEPTIPPPAPEEAMESESPVTQSDQRVKDGNAKKQPKVIEGETWRFSFTGLALEAVESQMKDLIQSGSPYRPVVSSAPGGMQYDLLVPVSEVLSMKERFEKISMNTTRVQAESKTLSTLSWYKKRKMGTRSIPRDHVQIVVWISTI